MSTLIYCNRGSESEIEECGRRRCPYTKEYYMAL